MDRERKHRGSSFSKEDQGPFVRSGWREWRLWISLASLSLSFAPRPCNECLLVVLAQVRDLGLLDSILSVPKSDPVRSRASFPPPAVSNDVVCAPYSPQKTASSTAQIVSTNSHLPSPAPLPHSTSQPSAASLWPSFETSSSLALAELKKNGQQETRLSTRSSHAVLGNVWRGIWRALWFTVYTPAIQESSV